MVDQIPMGALAGDYERCAHMLDDAMKRITELENDLRDSRAQAQDLANIINDMSANPRYWEARYRDEAAANDKLHGLLADIQDGCVVDSEGMVYVMDEEKVGEAIETYIALVATEKR